MMIAYNYNLPIIASDIEGFRERINNGVNGYLFKKNDIEDLKRILELCINQTPEEYERIRSNAKRFSDLEYGVDSIINKYKIMLNSHIQYLMRRK